MSPAGSCGPTRSPRPSAASRSTTARTPYGRSSRPALRSRSRASAPVPGQRSPTLTAAASADTADAGRAVTRADRPRRARRPLLVARLTTASTRKRKSAHWLYVHHPIDIRKQPVGPVTLSLEPLGYFFDVPPGRSQGAEFAPNGPDQPHLEITLMRPGLRFGKTRGDGHGLSPQGGTTARKALPDRSALRRK